MKVVHEMRGGARDRDAELPQKAAHGADASRAARQLLEANAVKRDERLVRFENTLQSPEFGRSAAANNRRSLMLAPRRVLFSLLTITGLSGMATGVLGQQVNDTAFVAGIDKPAHTVHLPRVGMDASHNNIFVVHTDRAAPLIEMMVADGMLVDTLSAGLTPSSLRRIDVAVILTAASGEAFQPGALIHSPFSALELQGVERFVADGGSLLFCVDHTPFGASGIELAARFGVRLLLGVVGDSVTRDPMYDSYTALLYTRENGGLGQHPILEGRDSSEGVRRMAVWGGISMVPSDKATPLLIVPPTATNRGERGTPMHGVGSAQAVALNHGRGRVVITGDCTMWTAQILTMQNGDFRIGMARSDLDNRQFALNVLRWLSGAFP